MEFALLLLVISFFLTLGADFPDPVIARMIYGAILLSASLLIFRKNYLSFSDYSNLSSEEIIANEMKIRSGYS